MDKRHEEGIQPNLGTSRSQILGSLKLHCAAAEGDLEVVKTLIEKSQYDPERKTFHGITPLHCASCCGMLNVVEYLVKDVKCDPTAEDSNGECPLVYCTYCTVENAEMKSPLDHYLNQIQFRIDHIRVALFLLQSRADILVTEKPKLLRVLRLPLTCGSFSFFSQIFEFVKVGKDEANESVGEEVYACLKMAIGSRYTYSQWDSVKLLLDTYPESLKLVMTSDIEHAKALFLKCFESGIVHVVRSFFSLGIYKPSVELADQAIQVNNLDLVKCVIESADHPLHVDESNNYWSSLLFSVLRYSYSDFDKKLVEFIAITFKDTNIMNYQGNTPLHVACSCPYINLRKFVIPLLNGIYQVVPNKAGQLPLHIACMNPNCEVIRLVSSHPKLDVNTKDIHGCTPLHELISSILSPYTTEVIPCLRCLIEEKRCSANIQNESGNLPLHIFLKFYHSNDYCNIYDLEKMIDLCSTHVNMNTQDNDGNTPLHIAYQTNPDLAQYLMSKYECNTNLYNNEGYLPIQCAVTSEKKHHDNRLTLHHSNISTACLCELLTSKNPEDSICSLCECEQKIDLLRSVATTQTVNEQVNGTTPIHVVCNHNNILAAKHLIEVLNCDLSVTDSKHRLPLHVASMCSVECVKLISSYSCVNSDVNVCDIDGNTPVHLALIHGNLDIAAYLLTNCKCNTSIKNKNDELPMHLACCTTLELVKLTEPPNFNSTEVNYCFQPKSTNFANRYMYINYRRYENTGGTMLHIACIAGSLEIVNYLVTKFECSPSMKMRDMKGRLAVDYACKHSLEMVKLVCQACTAEDLVYSAKGTTCWNSDELSTLIIACSSGSLTIVKYLMNEKGCKLAVLGNDHRALLFACGVLMERSEIHDTLLSYMYVNSNVDLISYLITVCGYSPTTFVKLYFSPYYCTALEYACKKKSLKLIKALTVISMDLTDDRGNTPLHYACMFGAKEIVFFLVNCECDQNIYNENGELALHLTCSLQSQHSLGIIKLLTKCDLRSLNGNGDTILHIAIASLKDDVVLYLLEEKGFDANIKNKKGESPLHIAIQKSSCDAMTLLTYGCDINCQDIDGNTPLHIACSQDHHNNQSILNFGFLAFQQSCRADIPNKYGNLALHKIVERPKSSKFSVPSSNDNAVVLAVLQKILNEYSESVRFVNSDGLTPVHIAIKLEGFIFFEALKLTKYNFSEFGFLHIACEYRQPQIVRWLLEHGANPTIANEDGNIPLHMCCLGKQPPCSFTLEQLGHCDIMNQNNNGDTIAHLACRRKEHKFLEKVLELSNGYPSFALSIQNNNKDTALHLAASISLEHVKLVATPENINLQNSNGDTPLHTACRSKHLASSKLSSLILYMINELNCSVEILNSDGDSPFHILLRQRLINSQHDPLLQCIPKSVCDRKNNNGETLLYIACKEMQISCITYLIEIMKCKTDTICDCNGATPLHLFFTHEIYMDLVEMLSLCNPRAQIMDTLLLPKNDKLVLGDTVLHVACRNGRSKFVKCLLNRNHDKALNIPNMHGEIPFHLACSHDVTMVEAFADHMSKFNCNAVVNSSGDTPLHIACRNVYLHSFVEPVIDPLVDKFKCKTDLINKHRELPLHLACRHRAISFNIIKKLAVGLSSDCLNLQNDFGDTPLHILLSSALYSTPSTERDAILDIVKFLTKETSCSDSSLGICNNDGKQPLHLACQNQVLSVVKYLHQQYKCLSLEVSPFLLHSACHNDDPAVLKYIIENVVHEVNFPDADGDLPLHIALRHSSSVPVTFSLIRRTKNINAANNQGNTALHELYIQRKFPSCSMFCNIQNRHVTSLDSEFFEEKCFKNDFDKLVHLWRKNRSTDETINQTEYHPQTYRNCILQLLLEFQHLDLSRQNLLGQTPLHCICTAGDYNDLKTILKRRGRINANVQDKDGFTPLHIACQANHVNGVKILLTVYGIELSIMTNTGETPITLATDPTIIKLLIEHGADPQPLYEKHRTFFVNISKSNEKPPPTPVKLLVVGNASVGKTTLIQSLQNESFMETISPAKFDHTAGVVPTKFSSSIYGDVTFYDFAGQPEYYASHDAVLHRTIRNAPPVVLILVNLMDSLKRITEQTHYWIDFMENRFHTTLADKAHLIIVCSHSDVVESHRNDPSAKVSRVVKRINSQVEGKNIILKDIIHINCTKSHSKEIEKLQQLLKKSTSDLRQGAVMHFQSHCFFVYLHQEFNGSNYITLACIFSKLKFQSIQSLDNPLHLLPSDKDKIVEFCQDLNDRGHIHFIKHSNAIERSWIVLDEKPLLQNLLGSLFAPANFPQHCPLSYSTGVVPLSRFKQHFSEKLDCSALMLLTFLSRMEYCREITDEEVLQSIVEKQGYSETEKYYFFPNLVSLERPTDKWKVDSKVSCQCGWLIQCATKSEFFSPHFIQALLLRLVFSLAPKKEDYDSKDFETSDDLEDEPNPVMDIVIKRKCSVWKNGLYMQDNNGVKTIVDIIDQRNLLVLMNCQARKEMSLIERRSTIISMVHNAKQEFCSKAEFLEYFMHPESIKHPLTVIDNSQLFSLPCIRSSINEAEGELYVINDHDQEVELETLLCFEPYAELDADVIRQLCTQSVQQTSDISVLLKSIAKQLHHRCPLLMRMITQRGRLPAQLATSNYESTLYKILISKFNSATCADVRKFFDQFSIFCGRQPPSRSGMFIVWIANRNVLEKKSILKYHSFVLIVHHFSGLENEHQFESGKSFLLAVRYNKY